MTKNSSSILKKISYLAAIGFSIFALFFVITCTWIGFDVKDQCKIAQDKYQSDCVTSLSALVEDESMPFRQRNSAIWALGQLGDSKALPTLEKYYTGIIPAREALDQGISQYELQKAIKMAKGGLNLSKLFWSYK